MGCTKCKTDGVRKWFKGPLLHLWIINTLFYWGENMWLFALELYLVYFEEGILRLAAIFGFCTAGSILLFGGILGNWVDRTPRLRSMVIAILVQDVSVIILSMLVFVVLMCEEQLMTTWLWHLLATSIVALAILATLFGMCFKISFERDWFVVVAAGDKTLLASINSVTRALDQACMILAPIVAGQIMTHVSLSMAALIIVGYCAVTIPFKFIFLRKLYRSEPNLSRRKTNPKPGEGEDGEEGENGLLSKDKPTAAQDKPTAAQDNHVGSSKSMKSLKENAFCKNFLLLFTGWATYGRQQVVLAGVGLALLYMTVLGFHTTKGYVYASGVSESTVGILTSIAGLFGIVGSLLFPVMRRKLTLEKTGMFGFWFLNACLVLPLISIWLPGSPFEPGFMFSQSETTSPPTNCTGQSSASYNTSGSVSANGSSVYPSPCMEEGEESPINVAIVVFLAGTLLSRIGLWIADLSVIQAIQETVSESERGVVSGVQNSLSMLLEITKFGLVIALPYVETFGYLVILSFAFVTAGGILFFVYTVKQKNHMKRTLNVDYTSEAEKPAHNTEDLEMETNDLENGSVQKSDKPWELPEEIGNNVIVIEGKEDLGNNIIATENEMGV